MPDKYTTVSSDEPGEGEEALQLSPKLSKPLISLSGLRLVLLLSLLMAGWAGGIYSAAILGLEIPLISIGMLTALAASPVAPILMGILGGLAVLVMIGLWIQYGYNKYKKTAPPTKLSTLLALSFGLALFIAPAALFFANAPFFFIASCLFTAGCVFTFFSILHDSVPVWDKELFKEKLLTKANLPVLLSFLFFMVSLISFIALPGAAFTVTVVCSTLATFCFAVLNAAKTANSGIAGRSSTLSFLTSLLFLIAPPLLFLAFPGVGVYGFIFIAGYPLSLGFAWLASRWVQQKVEVSGEQPSLSDASVSEVESKHDVNPNLIASLTASEIAAPPAETKVDSEVSWLRAQLPESEQKNDSETLQKIATVLFAKFSEVKEEKEAKPAPQACQAMIKKCLADESCNTLDDFAALMVREINEWKPDDLEGAEQKVEESLSEAQQVLESEAGLKAWQAHVRECIPKEINKAALESFKQETEKNFQAEKQAIETWKTQIDKLLPPEEFDSYDKDATGPILGLVVEAKQEVQRDPELVGFSEQLIDLEGASANAKQEFSDQKDIFDPANLELLKTQYAREALARNQKSEALFENIRQRLAKVDPEVDWLRQQVVSKDAVSKGNIEKIANAMISVFFQGKMKDVPAEESKRLVENALRIYAFENKDECKTLDQVATCIVTAMTTWGVDDTRHLAAQVVAEEIMKKLQLYLGKDDETKKKELKNNIILEVLRQSTKQICSTNLDPAIATKDTIQALISGGIVEGLTTVIQVNSGSADVVNMQLRSGDGMKTTLQDYFKGFEFKAAIKSQYQTSAKGRLQARLSEGSQPQKQIDTLKAGVSAGIRTVYAADLLGQVHEIEQGFRAEKAAIKELQENVAMLRGAPVSPFAEVDAAAETKREAKTDPDLENFSVRLKELEVARSTAEAKFTREKTAFSFDRIEKIYGPDDTDKAATRAIEKAGLVQEIQVKLDQRRFVELVTELTKYEYFSKTSAYGNSQFKQEFEEKYAQLSGEADKLHAELELATHPLPEININEKEVPEFCKPILATEQEMNAELDGAIQETTEWTQDIQRKLGVLRNGLDFVTKADPEKATVQEAYLASVEKRVVSVKAKLTQIPREKDKQFKFSAQDVRLSCTKKCASQKKQREELNQEIEGHLKETQSLYNGRISQIDNQISSSTLIQKLGNFEKNYQTFLKEFFATSSESKSTPDVAAWSSRISGLLQLAESINVEQAALLEERAVLVQQSQQINQVLGGAEIKQDDSFGQQKLTHYKATLEALWKNSEEADRAHFLKTPEQCKALKAFFEALKPPSKFSKQFLVLFEIASSSEIDLVALQDAIRDCAIQEPELYNTLSAKLVLIRQAFPRGQDTINLKLWTQNVEVYDFCSGATQLNDDVKAIELSQAKHTAERDKLFLLDQVYVLSSILEVVNEQAEQFQPLTFEKAEMPNDLDLEAFIKSIEEYGATVEVKEGKYCVTVKDATKSSELSKHVRTYLSQENSKAFFGKTTQSMASFNKWGEWLNKVVKIPQYNQLLWDIGDLNSKDTEINLSQLLRALDGFNVRAADLVNEKLKTKFQSDLNYDVYENLSKIEDKLVDKAKLTIKNLADAQKAIKSEATGAKSPVSKELDLALNQLGMCIASIARKRPAIDPSLTKSSQARPLHSSPVAEHLSTAVAPVSREKMQTNDSTSPPPNNPLPSGSGSTALMIKATSKGPAKSTSAIEGVGGEQKVDVPSLGSPRSPANDLFAAKLFNLLKESPHFEMLLGGFGLEKKDVSEIVLNRWCLKAVSALPQLSISPDELTLDVNRLYKSIYTAAAALARESGKSGPTTVYLAAVEESFREKPGEEKLKLMNIRVETRFKKWIGETCFNMGGVKSQNSNRQHNRAVPPAPGSGNSSGLLPDRRNRNTAAVPVNTTVSSTPSSAS